MSDKDLRPLSSTQINSMLASYPGWQYQKDKIIKKFKFSSFLAGLNLINQLASFCEKIDHHPDIHIYYKTIIFELNRHSVGGKVTPRDFKVADEIEKIYSSLSS